VIKDIKIKKKEKIYQEFTENKINKTVKNLEILIKFYGNNGFFVGDQVIYVFFYEYGISCGLSVALASGQSVGPSTKPGLIETDWSNTGTVKCL
jgi:hypothetical protein